MIFIVRTGGAWWERWQNGQGVEVALARRTPPLVADVTADPGGRIDLFCIGDEAAADRLRAAGWTVVPLHDGWYADDQTGGVAVWGQGAYWEIRDTPFTVVEAAGPADAAEPDSPDAMLDVRRGIFGV
jgi:hypothetical protein